MCSARLEKSCRSANSTVMKRDSAPRVSGIPVLINFRTTSSGTKDENERSEVSNNDNAVCSSLISLIFDEGGAACENVRSSTDRSSRDTLSIGRDRRREK